jgi:hypothetical protein
MTTNGTVSNGITAVGVKDKFLSLKWDPVESATSYAIYKEGSYCILCLLTL